MLRPPLRRLAVAAVSLVVLASCAGAGADSDASSPGSSDGSDASAAADDAGDGSSSTTTPIEVEALAEGDDLYAPPDPVPAGEPGTLLRFQPIEPTVQEGADTYRMMYLSESMAGAPIVVTGTALVPTQAAPDGGRVRLTLAHGTRGLGDDCAPSKGPQGSELSLMGSAVESGWLVAMTDYEGMGTPGRHPYLVGESAGRSVLDAARAAAALPDADAGDQLLIAGYSQGGHGAAWAAELAPQWAPELDVVGTFAGAPASEVELILKAAPHLPQAGFAYMLIAGLAAAHPELDLADVLTDEGQERIGVVDEGCTTDVFAAFAGTPASELIRQEGVDSGPWPERAAESDAGTVATDAPMLIIHSDADRTVPPPFSQRMVDRLCSDGQVVERRLASDGKGHSPEALVAYPAALEWFEGLLAGEQPVSSCT